MKKTLTRLNSIKMVYHHLRYLLCYSIHRFILYLLADYSKDILLVVNKLVLKIKMLD